MPTASTVKFPRILVAVYTLNHRVQVGEGFGRSPAERNRTASAGRHFVFERPPLDAQEVIASAREVVGQSRSRQTEGEGDGPPRVASPIDRSHRELGGMYEQRRWRGHLLFAHARSNHDK
jgi:hypothetical protein